MNITKVIDIGGIIMYYKNCRKENKQINSTIKNNLNRKSLPRLVRLTINKDKIDSYIIKIKYNNFKETNKYFNRRSVYCDIRSLLVDLIIVKFLLKMNQSYYFFTQKV